MTPLPCSLGAQLALIVLLVRADLLASSQSVESTSLQLEYLPSGHICRGHVTEIGGTSFSGRCRLPSGGGRVD